jgi:hypothetical protein
MRSKYNLNNFVVDDFFESFQNNKHAMHKNKTFIDH